jgi:hypothetical protein
MGVMLRLVYNIKIIGIFGALAFTAPMERRKAFEQRICTRCNKRSLSVCAETACRIKSAAK